MVQSHVTLNASNGSGNIRSCCGGSNPSKPSDFKKIKAEDFDQPAKVQPIPAPKNK